MILVGFFLPKYELSRHIMLELLKGIRKMEEEKMRLQATMKKLWMCLILYCWYRKSQMFQMFDILVMIKTVSIDGLVSDPKTGQRRNERLGA